MSNSDNPKSADEKLDALYKLTQESESPADIDSHLMASARRALESEASSSTALWKNRYGWATAATLLLTSTLFLSVTNDPSPKGSDALSPKPSPENTVAAEPVTPAPSTPALAASDQDLEAQIEVEQPQLRQHKRGTESRLTADLADLADLKDAATATQNQNRFRSAAKRTPLDQLARPAVAVSCKEYPNLLIDRVCWYTADNETVGPNQFRLYASPTSECAGQTLRLQTAEGAPTPHPTSTAQRFVFARKEATVDSAQDSIRCVAGKLERQSLALGR
jgi:hypothetical protein